MTPFNIINEIFLSRLLPPFSQRPSTRPAPKTCPGSEKFLVAAPHPCLPRAPRTPAWPQSCPPSGTGHTRPPAGRAATTGLRLGAGGGRGPRGGWGANRRPQSPGGRERGARSREPRARRAGLGPGTDASGAERQRGRPSPDSRRLPARRSAGPRPPPSHGAGQQPPEDPVHGPAAGAAPRPGGGGAGAEQGGAPGDLPSRGPGIPGL